MSYDIWDRPGVDDDNEPVEIPMPWTTLLLVLIMWGLCIPLVLYNKLKARWGGAR